MEHATARISAEWLPFEPGHGPPHTRQPIPVVTCMPDAEAVENLEEFANLTNEEYELLRTITRVFNGTATYDDEPVWGAAWRVAGSFVASPWRNLQDADLSPDRRFLITINRANVARLWRVATGHALNQIACPTWPIPPERTDMFESWVHEAKVRIPPDDVVVSPSGTVARRTRLGWVMNGMIISGYLPPVFSPTGHLVAGYLADIQVWRVDTGTLVHHIAIQRGDRVRGMALSPNGRWLAAIINDVMILAFDLHANARRHRLRDVMRQPAPIAFSPQNELLYWTEGNRLAAYDLLAKRICRQIRFPPHSNTNSTISARGTHLLRWDNQAPTIVYEVATGTEVFRVNSATRVRFSSTGRELLTLQGRGALRIWDTASGRELTTYKGHTASVETAATNERGDQFVTGALDGSVYVWTSRCEPVAHFTCDPHVARAVRFVGDGHYVAATTHANITRIFRLDTNREHLRLYHLPTGIAISCNGQWALTAQPSAPLTAWNIQSRARHMIHAPLTTVARVLDISSSGEWAVAVLDDGTPRLWRVGDAEDCLGRPLDHHGDTVQAAAFSPDSRFVATVSIDGATNEGVLRIWDAAAGVYLQRFLCHPEVLNVTFSPRGQHVAVRSARIGLEVFNLQTGDPSRFLTPDWRTAPPRDVGILPDETAAWVLLRDRLLMFELAPQSWRGPSLGRHESGAFVLLDMVGYRPFLSTVAFTPDVSRLVVGTDEGSVWVLERLDPSAILTPHRSVSRRGSP